MSQAGSQSGSRLAALSAALPTPSAARPRRIRVRSTLEQADALSGCLFDAGAEGLQEEAGDLITYCSEGELFERIALALEQFDEHLKRSGEAPLEIEVDAPENTWDSQWLSALAPAQVTKKWMLRPTHCSPAPEGEHTLWFEPQVSFGSGDHDTTQLAASKIEEYCQEHQPSELFDVGTGTGILAMVAHKCGVASIRAVDTDETAVRSAQNNFTLNELSGDIVALVGSADCRQRDYSFVVANINTHILLRIAEDLANSTLRAGTLLLTGLLVEDVPEVLSTFAALGFQHQETREQGKWALLELKKLTA